MSDLSLSPQPATSQLPVSSYFDEALFQRELETIFQRGPRYVGHQLSVPNPGDYYALPQENAGRALVRNPHGQVELISNVCRHRQATMLQGRGSLQEQQKGSAGGNIVCPVHRWTYSASGQLLGAPHFSHDPCLHLKNYPLREWNGLLFEDNGRDIEADLADMGPRAQLSFDGFTLDRTELHECNYNWKTFIEVYLEDYHVARSTPAWATLSLATIWRGSSKKSIRCKPSAWPRPLVSPDRMSTKNGTRCCCNTAKANCPSAAPFG